MSEKIYNGNSYSVSVLEGDWLVKHHKSKREWGNSLVPQTFKHFLVEIPATGAKGCPNSMVDILCEEHFKID